ncbi:pentatricopeptide repeat-containing protein At2g02980, chloroplastic-like [Magnolia sinica]|uniref:pentatricopeptide repeat-containing protein At2g02980, chloroplastic-like n=1 Tax=Magnolia sinica TaxID=86752 RepID=UPI0026589CC7|nr:pentatricopeptide repeat-containing protein At2g02980, chloroplastic-like [Magnolia sinica]
MGGRKSNKVHEFDFKVVTNKRNVPSFHRDSLKNQQWKGILEIGHITIRGISKRKSSNVGEFDFESSDKHQKCEEFEIFINGGKQTSITSSREKELPERTELEERIQSLLQKCPNMKILRQIHAHLLTCALPFSPKSYALTKILAFCALSPSGDLAYARQVFAQIPNPNVFSWNSMIRGLTQVEKPSKEPISLYKEMLELGFAYPNSFTFAFVLKACAVVSAFEEGLQIHSHVFRHGLDSSPFVQTGLLNFYAKCEEIGCARGVFDEISERNLIAWSAMISGYARVGLVNEAFGLFREMQKVGICPDEVMMVSIISACAKAGALDLGSWIHAFIDRSRIKLDLELSTALVNMYAKCGCIERAVEVFDEMPNRDTQAWSSMIVGLAIHGLAEDTLEVFYRMGQAKVKPNQVTFIGVLSACAHSGLVYEGLRFWSCMLEYGVKPSMEHYGCMVDLLCHGGQVEEAYEFVETMPILPNSIIWRTLLVGCKNNWMLDKGERIAERLLELEPLNAENYVLLSNLYASNRQWEKVSYVRKKMKENGIKAMPGCSSIEVDGFVHEFVMGDESHPEAKDIREVLMDISEQVRLVGHEPWTSTVLHDVGEEEKESALFEHSERLAIAYGMLKTKAPVVIRVVKNLRVCGDCHEVTKIISKVYGREIIVRDRVRFHRFINGGCSCKDYW